MDHLNITSQEIATRLALVPEENEHEEYELTIPNAFLQILRSDSRYSVETASNSTVSNIQGPGRTVDNFVSFLGQGLEALLTKFGLWFGRQGAGDSYRMLEAAMGRVAERKVEEAIMDVMGFRPYDAHEVLKFGLGVQFRNRGDRFSEALQVLVVMWHTAQSIRDTRSPLLKLIICCADALRYIVERSNGGALGNRIFDSPAALDELIVTFSSAQIMLQEKADEEMFKEMQAVLKARFPVNQTRTQIFDDTREKVMDLEKNLLGIIASLR
ncbi:hypothetical protein NEOLEDRAFT_1128360 [Neolentinus lepideus HHB14362 ss-1]|uniref:Uncharacterized protein n=1 Tax=Neolentinus lepideus HHB14362 ss-1 TaxID=1314782 RepID=A0A165VET0_9AGAM|nr:hypothetical protein NEOLEDRAFT_1128360 [Neolentinus lepideus HHB14362 ss-1]